MIAPVLLLVLIVFPGAALSAAKVSLIAPSLDWAALNIPCQRLHVVLAHTTGSRPRASVLNTVVRIRPDARGQYTSAGRINGMAIRFRVDLGSALVKLNAVQAARLGIEFRRTGTRMLVNTASGRTRAYRLRLARVQVGGIQLTEVQALVMDGAEPATALLGMSFLGRLRLRHEGRVLILAPIR